LAVTAPSRAAARPSGATAEPETYDGCRREVLSFLFITQGRTVETDEFRAKVIDLVQSLDEMAREQRLKDSHAAVNCAQTAASLRSWLEEMGLGPKTDPLKP